MTKRYVGIAGVALMLAILATACAPQATPAPTPAATPIPAIALNAASGDVTASGEVVPARKAALGFATAGRVQDILVEVGDVVQAGDVLMRLDDAAAQAAVAQAEASLLRARAQLDELKAGPREQEIERARASVDAAKAHLAQLTEGARPEEVAAANAALAAAKAAERKLFSGPSKEDRIAAEAALSNAEAARNQAQSAYDQVAWRSDIALRPESRQLQEATNNYEAAKARYDALFAKPDDAAVSAARAQVQQAQAALDRLNVTATPGQIAEAEAQVRSAQADLDLLTAGARAESIAMAEAVVAEAEAALQRAQADLANYTLLAPFAATLTDIEVNPGEMVLPGQTVLTLADLDHLQVETTDLSERDVARVTVGLPVLISVKPLGTEIKGRVLRIAPQASVIGGDVVYPVIIALDEQPAALRWGMSVDVNIQSE